MPRKQRLCPDPAEFRRLYVEEHYTLPRLFARFSCDQRCVYRWLAELGIVRRKRGALNTRHLDPREVHRLYHEENKSVAEVAVALGTGQNQVRKCMRRHHIAARRTGPRDMEHHGSWNGGKQQDKHGYILVYCPDHPQARRSGYVAEHRLVAEQMLGRPLRTEEVVHHKNRKKADNRPENLEVFAKNADHLRHELTGKCPRWTEEGKRRIAAGVRKKRKPRAQKSTGPLRLTPDAPASS